MKQNSRIILVDALRGFALMGIVLIHFVEHFDFFYEPETNFLFSPGTDKVVMDIVMFLVSGKAYSIFALTFGFSFFIQLNRKEEKGIDYRGRFAWRLTILLFMGLLHSLVYRGDILHIYAILGFPLILLYKVNNKVLIALAALLIIEVPILYHLAHSFMDPVYTFIPDWGGTYFQECEDAYAYGSLWEVMNVNLWKGRYLVYAWTFYTGRAVQLFALFIIGLLIGRGRYFEEIEKYRKQITRVLALSIVFILVLHFASLLINNAALSELQKELLTTLVRAFNNLAYTGAIVSLFILAYLKFGRNLLFLSLATYGKMSLTNYVVQALVGVTLFYGFGFGLWRYLGATWSLLAGMVFFFIQLSFSRYWVSHYLYGPLEWIWRSITLLDYHLPIRRSDVSGKAT